MLAGIRLNQTSVDDAGQIVRHHIVHYFICRRVEADVLLHDSRRYFRHREICLFQREQLFQLRLLFHRIYHLGKQDKDFIQLPVQKSVHHCLGNQSGPVHGRFLNRIAEAAVHIHVLQLAEILAADYSQHIQLPVSRKLQAFLRHLDNVMVVGAVQPLVGRDHDQADLPIPGSYLRALIQIPVLLFRIGKMAQHTVQRALHAEEVRLRIRKDLLRLLHLRGGYQIHGIRNLHRVLDALHPGLDLFNTCHLSSPASVSFIFLCRFHNRLNQRLRQFLLLFFSSS